MSTNYNLINQNIRDYYAGVAELASELEAHRDAIAARCADWQAAADSDAADDIIDEVMHAIGYRQWRITVRGAENHISNPLLALDGQIYDTREAACEDIYNRMYDVIDSENGCEMVDRPDTSNIEDDIVIIDRYIDECHKYIMREGRATEDGVTATVEEI